MEINQLTYQLRSADISVAISRLVDLSAVAIDQLTYQPEDQEQWSS